MSIEVPKGWIQDDGAHGPPVYHTNKDCPYFPSKVRNVDDGDMRRSVRECSQCKILNR